RRDRRRPRLHLADHVVRLAVGLRPDHRGVPARVRAPLVQPAGHRDRARQRAHRDPLLRAAGRVHPGARPLAGHPERRAAAARMTTRDQATMLTSLPGTTISLRGVLPASSPTTFSSASAAASMAALSASAGTWMRLRTLPDRKSTRLNSS